MDTLEKKKFVRLSYSSKAIKLEEEELNVLDEKYGVEFSKDFSEENQYFLDTQASREDLEIHTNESVSGDLEGKDVSHGEAVKKIHRALARVTHPDVLAEDHSDEDFKDIQSAYEQGDISTLVVKACDLGVAVDLTSKELAELEKKIENQRQSIQKIKTTMKWVWAESDKSSVLRRKMQVALGIDPDKFYEWQKKKNQETTAADKSKT